MKPLKNFFLIVWILVLLSGSIFFGSAEGAVIKLNGTLPTDSLIYDWQASPNGGRVVYSTGPNRAYKNTLFSVPAGGGTAVQITPPVTGDERIISYQTSPDSTRVVFLMRPSEYAASEIYSVPIGGGAVTKLNENISSQVNTFLFTPDSQKVVYQAVVPVINQWGLYSVPLAGPANSSVRIDTNSSYHVDSGFKISSDSSRVVYRAPCLYGPDAGQSCTGMYSVPVAGGSSAVLSLAGAYYAVYSGIEISPDSQYVVYRAYYPPDWSGDIYSIPIAGTPSSDLLRLSHYIAGNVTTWQISPDSSRVVFIAMQDTAGTSELYSIPIRLTGSVVKLNGALATDGQVSEFAISPDGNRVGYRSYKESGSDNNQIYRTPLGGPAGQAVLLNEPLPGFGVRHFRFSPNSQHVVFEIAGYGPGPNNFVLFGVPAAGPSSQQVQVGNIYDYTVFYDISHDSSWVYYIRDGNLFKSPITGPIGNTVILDGPPNHLADTFLQTPDGAKLIYSAESFGNLYAVDAVTNSTQHRLYLPLITK